MIDKYKKKENYITRDPDPKKWKTHPNGNILILYSDIIKGSVLDFGCNHGACTFLLCDNPTVKSVVGLDLNQSAIDVANNTKVLYTNCCIEFVCDNVLNFKHNSIFDTIISFHTLEHIYPEDIEYVLVKLYNLLSYGGYFIVSIPYEYAFNNDQHVCFYNEVSLSELFEKCGFETIECLKDNRHSESGILTGIFKKTNEKNNK